jgi:8-amino-7-oxononanoate synthase
MNVLREMLRDATKARRRLIVTDSLFSMDGDVAPLPDLVELAEQHQAILVVDEAHATGVFGPTGRGVCELHEVEQHVPVRIGTLSKALGSVGGFAVGSRRLINWLFNRARPQVFSTSLPAACHMASLKALQIVKSEPQRRERVLQSAARVRAWLAQEGLDIGRSASQIIPIVLRDPARTMQATRELDAHGLWVPGIRPPTVPVGESLLRISLSATHTDQQIQQLQEAIRRVCSVS